MLPRLYVVDPNLKDFVGHHLEYDKALCNAWIKNSGHASILAHQKMDGKLTGLVPARPTFRWDIWQAPNHCGIFSSSIGALAANLVFFRDLIKALPKNRNDAQIIFFHMITKGQILGAALFCAFAQKQCDRVVLLLRYQPGFYRNAISGAAFRIIEYAARRRRIQIASDSARLAHTFRALTRLPVKVLPIPHTVRGINSASIAKQVKPLTFVSLGGARDEKGIFEILAAICLLERSDDLRAIRFILQTNDAQPDVRAAIDRFKLKQPPSCTLIEQALESAEYDALLNRADVVLVPYWRSIYEARTSGVFLEAVAAGKPVIATEDTWMSDELSHYGGGILVKDRDPEALAEAIREAIRTYAALQQAAYEGREKCLAVHNAEALARQITDETAASA